jgi:large subunit ribosomal protein L28
MSRRCIVTGKAVLVGNNVSHANNKNKRRFLPNLQVTSLLSDVLKKSVRLRITTRGIKTVEHAGGLDAWLLKSRNADLDTETRRLKKLVKKALDRKAAAAA